MFKPYQKILVMVVSLAPIVVSAQSVTSFKTFVAEVVKLINSLIPIVFGIALIVFFWGIAVFILNSGDVQKRDDGKKIMVWGIIALFVMVSVWGIVRVLLETFGL